MSDIKKQIDELIEIAKAATPGPWHDQSWQEDRFYSKQELADCKFSAAFDSTVAIKLLESWKEMREALEFYAKGDHFSHDSLGVTIEIEDTGEVAEKALAKAYKVFE